MPHAPTSASFSVYSHGSRTGRVPVPKGSTAFQPTVHRPKENLLSGVVVMVVSFRTSVFSWRRWRRVVGGAAYCCAVADAGVCRARLFGRAVVARRVCVVTIYLLWGKT